MVGSQETWHISPKLLVMFDTRESCYGLGLRLITPWFMRNYTYLGSNTGNYGLENAILRLKIIKMKFVVLTRFKFKKNWIFVMNSIFAVISHDSALKFVTQNYV